jgi:hypothetical protein
MVFVPSKDGVSHNPVEYTSPEDCAIGAQVILGALLRFDELRAQKEHGAWRVDTLGEFVTIIFPGLPLCTIRRVWLVVYDQGKFVFSVKSGYAAGDLIDWSNIY